MNDTSHVSLERHVCLVCDVEYDTGAILLDRRWRPSMKMRTTTGWGVCPTHKQLFNDGFVALIECDPTRSDSPPTGSHVKPDQAYRTGKIAYLKREAFAKVFDVPIKPDLPLVFVEPGVLEKLQALAAPSNTDG